MAENPVVVVCGADTDRLVLLAALCEQHSEGSLAFMDPGNDFVELPYIFVSEDSIVPDDSELGLRHVSLTELSVDRLDMLMREFGPREMVVRLQQPMKLKELVLPPEPTKSRYEELRDAPRSPRRAQGRRLKMLNRAKG